MRFLPILLCALSLFGGEKVFKLYTNDGTHEWCATAFFVGPTTLLTAAHTFANTERKGFHNHFLIQDGHREPVKLLKIDYDADVAVITGNFSVSDFYTLNETPSGTVTVCGYKGESRKLSEDRASLKKLSKWLEVNCPAISGVSGGPMVNEDGTVSGMVKKGDEKKTQGIPASKLLSFLQAVPDRR